MEAVNDMTNSPTIMSVGDKHLASGIANPLPAVKAAQNVDVSRAPLLSLNSYCSILNVARNCPYEISFPT